MAREHIRYTETNSFEARRRSRESLIKGRLNHVYEFAKPYIGSNHLDIGTYDGFALADLASAQQFTGLTTSIDINPEMIQTASARPEVQSLIVAGKLNLLEMDAREMSSFPNTCFDSATIIEVFGGGFEGEEEDVRQIFLETQRVLQIGSPLVFTIKSRSSEQFLQQYFDWNVPKGYPQHRSHMERILAESGFSPVDWHGHVFVTLNEAGNPALPLVVSNTNGVLRTEIDKLKFRPQPAADFEKGEQQTMFPLYWIGVTRKL